MFSLKTENCLINYCKMSFNRNRNWQKSNVKRNFDRHRNSQPDEESFEVNIYIKHKKFN